jgi:hypothetical protein
VPSATPLLSEDERKTLSSLERVDEYPLYIMHYSGPLKGLAELDDRAPAQAWTGPVAGCEGCSLGCSLFTSLGDPENRLYGRNLQADPGPGLLLFTDPPNGYASVTMVNLKWVTFGDRKKDLTKLSLAERKMLLFAAAVPFDGMNEKGLAIGMASIDSGGGGRMHPDPKKKSISEFAIMREVLDHAATVDEAIAVFNTYNINMAGIPFHYLVASASGESAIIEFYKSEMVVIRNEHAWQQATNFLVTTLKDEFDSGGCGRYSEMRFQLQDSEGMISSKDALGLLYLVSDPKTIWRVLYHMSTGEIDVVMGYQPGGDVHHFSLDGQAP